ncbi:MAG: hypothetical protein PHE43_03445 [Candidatus Nanoarchaeia archaeon]|nr:hypothetical protein [Candidatus Nanoarchaeia archaeon]
MNIEKIKQDARSLIELSYKRDESIRLNKKTKEIDEKILALCDSIESSL